MPSRRGKTDKSTTSGGTDSTQPLKWDHSALTQRAWLHAMCKTLNGDPKHKSFAAGNYCSASKGLTAVYSAEQAADISDGNIRALKHSMNNPMPAGTYSITPTPLTSEMQKRFVVAPELLDDQAALLLSDITEGMDDEGCAEEYRANCHDNPCTLLITLHTQCDNISDNASGKTARDLANLFLRGPDSPDVPAFNRFKTEVDSLNRTVKSSDRIDNPTLAGKLIRAVNLLGHDIKNDLKAEVRFRGAENNLILSCTAIRTVLGDCEVDESEPTYGAARAATARTDPRYLPEPEPRPKGMTHPNRLYAASDGDCRHCGRAAHWSADCPNKPSKAEAEKKRKAKAKRAKAKIASKKTKVEKEDDEEDEPAIPSKVH